MSLVDIRKLKGANYLGIWKIEEDESFFHQQLQLNDAELEYLNVIKVMQRRLQWLSSRLLIRKIINPPGQILMRWDERGKPELINYDFEISISHCSDQAAVIVGDRKAGLDIEEKDEKILRIGKKFMNSPERDRAIEGLETEYHLAIWAAKESVFKFHGGGGIDFRGHIEVFISDIRESGTFKAIFRKEQPEITHEVRYEWHGNHLLTWLI